MTTKTKQYDYIDITRGIAILGVIAVHSHQPIKNLTAPVSWVFNYGQLGVQLFFIASALTLCLSATERKEISPYNFYVRRLFRIAPLYYIAIVLYLSVGTLKNYINFQQLMLPPQYTPLAIISNIFFVHGLYEPGNNSIVPGGWSIGTEMLFYLIFPIIYTISQKLTLPKYIGVSFLILIAIFSLEWVVNKLISVNPDNSTFEYFNILNQLPVFLLGVYVFHVLTTHYLTRTKILLAVLFGLTSCFLLNTEFKTGFNGFLIPTLSGLSFVVLVLWLRNKNASTSILYVALKKIGKVSYSMYILQFIVLQFTLAVLKISVFNFITLAEVQLFIYFSLTTTITFFLASISKKAIEDRGIRYGKNFLHN